MILKVAIIGAGPSGCMLARLLLHSKIQIDVSVFEADSTPNLRKQGGTLDIHEADGQAALKAAGLFDEFKKYARYDGEALQVADKNFLRYLHMRGNGENTSTGRPEIDRPKLREILHASLPEGTVKWNRKLASIISSPEGSRTLHFADGHTESGFDLIVGADGAWSKTRPAVSDAQPYYSGIGGHELRINDAERRAPELYKLVNRGSIFSFSDGRSIMAQYMGEGCINVGTWAVRSEDWQKTSSYDVHDATAARQALLDEYKDWDARLLDFIRRADDDAFNTRNLYMLPVGHRWTHVPGVTLIGDAAHLATPFAGLGVNLALRDSLKLSQAILAASSPDEVDHNIASFEEDMFDYAGKAQELTYQNLQSNFLTPGAPRKGIEEWICRALEDEFNPLLMLVARPLVYVYFFVFKLIW